MPRFDRAAVAAALHETAALLAASGEKSYKTRAYTRGARVVEELTESELARLAREERLTELPGIGESLARQIAELVSTGRSEFLERMRAKVSPEALQRWRERSDTVLLARGMELEPALVRALGAAAGVRRVSAAGELRRRIEVLSRIDLVAESVPKSAALEALVRLPAASATLERDASSATVRLASGELVRVEAAAPSAFASTLLDATGSEAHVARLAELARPLGIEVARAGWKKDGAPLRAREEADLYAALGVPSIPPELRDDDGELQAARRGTLALDLVTEADVRGFVHCHTHHSDGVDTVLAMARAAERAGKEYITITDHSPTAHYAGGLPLPRLKEQWEEIEEARPKVGVAILKGTESDILPDGSLDYPNAVLAKLDVIVASLHARNRQDREAMTRRLSRAMRHPYFKIWGHPLGRLLRRRPPAECDVDAVLDALVESRGAIEINGDPHRLDMEPRLIRRAKRRGLVFAISTDAHSTFDLRFLAYGVAIARRGGLTPKDVLNTLDADAFADAVRPKPRAVRKSA